MGDRISDLEGRFGIPGVARFEAGPNGLARAVISAPDALAHVYLQGAHVTHYEPRGQAPLLFLSRESRFEPGKAIRGGVPVIFPWFGARAGDPAAPQHGFTRVAGFDVESVNQAADGTVTVTLHLEADDASRRAWPHGFTLRYRVGVGQRLTLALEVVNTSTGRFAFEAALHTYLALGDVREALITGLGGSTYIDKTDGMTRKQEGTTPLRLTGETDRVYLGTRATCMVDDPAGGRRLVVDKAGSETTVVWNPWVAKARALADLGDDEWPGMICIETANAADHAVTLEPGARHEMQAVLRAEPR